MRQLRSMVAVGALLLAPGLAACGGADGTDAVAGAASARTGQATSADPPGSATAPPRLSPSGSAGPATVPPSAPAGQEVGASPWSSEPLRVDHPLKEPVQLVGVRSAHHEDAGMAFDRLVFEFAGGLPGYDVRYVADVRDPGQGAVVPLRGQAFLEVVFHPAVAHDSDGRPTPPTGRDGGGLPALVQYRMAGDYEGYVHYGLGVDDRVGVRVLELANPYRVVLDIAA
ncbi:hypothetical protein I6A84_05690 [Frankia sp. CNm7]|uniref:AMIN-like domain-containing protein n=1 Tax=Frankia nepalensis TaxID=1836974 RepID=A0A937RN60_9ACTN|nr:hypothetical protein [Frankia nepalensis]MBL7495316.1 hypothetical protein [Frankia nepalensis]MBL7509695.1 hypothetical protein [Frankia nepalensis]MBL7517630.1 hypothetical protein [Frankia nepalensis]MBL7631849.1 hypothetical protein [Frankia nepalensis]